MTVKLLEVPFDPEIKTLSVLNSPENDSDPLKIKKLEFAGLSPFCVNATEIVLALVEVFLTVKNRVTKSNLISFMAPRETFDDVT
jgi:hypothetical protein